MATKLHVPRARPELVNRGRLLATLATGGPRALTVVEAPPGSGKTTLLTQWQHADERPFAWLSLDDGDNDPAEFWAYVVEALRTVNPEIGAETLSLLGAQRGPVTELALPALINDLVALDGQLVLVLDDYHVISETQIHGELEYLLEHMPATLQVALATRVAPPLRLPLLRARGELVHLRAGELRFSPDEAAALLAALGLDLDGEDVAELQQRTEGWAAGLYLAALSLRSRGDTHGFIASFAGDDRHLVDYLAAEALDGQPADIRSFLLRTSVLRRMSAPLCDAVTGDSGSADALAEIERSNLFLIPLDDRRRWYRYHHLFGRLLELELERTEPELLPDLHRRAARWHRDRGDVSEAIHHAAAAGETAEAADLIAEHWNALFNHGRLATVGSWLDTLPPESVERDRRLAVARAWLALDRGRLDEAGRWIALAEAGGKLDSATALLGAVHRFKVGDLEAAHAAALRTLELEPDSSSFTGAVAHCIGGIALYWQGEPVRAAAALEVAVDRAREGANELGAAYALGYRALIDAGNGDLDEAEAGARAALGESDEPGFAEHFVLTIAHLAGAEAMKGKGRMADARQSAARAVALSRRGAGRLEAAAALLALAEAEHSTGDTAAARELAGDAAALVESCPDPGFLGPAAADAARRLGRARRSRGPEARDELSDRELAVLRLLPSRLSQREIGGELYVSLNTVKSHLRSIYRKLDASGREEAVARARELGLI